MTEKPERTSVWSAYFQLQLLLSVSAAEEKTRVLQPNFNLSVAGNYQ